MSREAISKQRGSLQENVDEQFDLAEELSLYLESFMELVFPPVMGAITTVLTLVAVAVKGNDICDKYYDVLGLNLTALLFVICYRYPDA